MLIFASMFQSHICTLLNITQYLVLSHPFNYVLSILIVYIWMSGWKTSLTKIKTSKILVRGCSKYIYKNTLTRILLLSQNCGLVAFSNTALFLLATRILPASTNFGQAKHGKKGPAATFRPKGVCSPMYTSLFIFYGPSQYLSSFSSNYPKSKKSNFFALWSPARKRREILGWAIKGEKPGIHRGTNAFWAKIGCGAVLTLFWSPNVGRGRQNVIR